MCNDKPTSDSAQCEQKRKVKEKCIGSREKLNKHNKMAFSDYLKRPD